MLSQIWHLYGRDMKGNAKQASYAKANNTVTSIVSITTALIAAVNFSTASSSVDRIGVEQSFQEIVTWVKTTGTRTVVRGNVASQMQLGDDDIAVIERGFRSISGGITHVFAVGSGPRFAGVVFIARVDETSGDAIVWSTSASGRLELTVKVDSNVGAQRVRNSPTEADFTAEKKYFLAQMQASDNRLRQSPR